MIFYDIDNGFSTSNDWRLLVFDGFEGHLSSEVIDFCEDHNIIAFCLPAHTSHKTQPLDTAVFGPLNRKYGNLVNHHHRVVKKHRFPKLLQEARQGACTKDNAITGWMKSGLYPFKRQKILKTLRKPTNIDCNWSESEPEIDAEPIFRETPGPAQRAHDALQYHAPIPITRSVLSFYPMQVITDIVKGRR